MGERGPRAKCPADLWEVAGRPPPTVAGRSVHQWQLGRVLYPRVQEFEASQGGHRVRRVDQQQREERRNRVSGWGVSVLAVRLKLDHDEQPPAVLRQPGDQHRLQAVGQ